MRSRIRSSFALRLLAGGLAMAMLLIVGISTFLLVSRQQQTRTAALTNADNRAKVIGQLFEQIGNANQLPPGVAAWSPDVLFALAGTYMLLRMRS